MKTKTLKVVLTILMAVFTLCSVSQIVLANDDTTKTVGKTPQQIIEGIDGDPTNVDAGGLMTMANNILGLIQVAAAVATVVLVGIFGFKFILGSANEKADYQKSFIPLIVGVVVVFAASSIAKLLFSTFGTAGESTNTTNP